MKAEPVRQPQLLLDAAEAAQAGETIARNADGRLAQPAADHGPATLNLGLRARLSEVRPSDLKRRLADMTVGQHELRRLNWALAAFAESVSTLARSASAEELMSMACRSIVAQDAYVLALVGLAERSPGKPVRIVAKAGLAAAYAEGLDMSWDENSPSGNGPTGLAIRSGAPQVMRDARTDPIYPRWRGRAAAHGILSTASVPFRKDGEVIGVLAIYASEPNAFGAQEIGLFERLGAQLATAISLADARERREAIEEARRGIDVTERHDAETARRESEARYRTLFDHAPDGILIADPEGRYLDANPSICRLLGYDRDELIGSDARRIVVSAELDHIAPALATITGTAPYNREWVFRRKDGTTLPAEVVATKMPYGAVMAMVRDVTDRHAAEAQRLDGERALRDMQGQLARFGRVSVLGEFAATIAHEVNQPLAAIVANCDAASRWLSVEPPNLDRAREAMGRIVRDSNRAHEVIKRTRAFSVRGEAEFSDIDLNEAIHEVVLMTREEQRKSGVIVIEDLLPDLPKVHGNRIELQQVVLNLCMNGIEAMHSIAKRNRILIIQTQVDAEGAVVVLVQDTGEGFDAETSERLFERFFTTKAGGTGLGLRISRTIVEAHGGRLRASRVAPHGALFQFTIPTATVEKTKEIGVKDSGA